MKSTGTVTSLLLIAALGILGCSSNTTSPNTTTNKSVVPPQAPVLEPTATLAPRPIPMPGGPGPVFNPNISANEALPLYEPAFINGIMVTNATINQTIINLNVTVGLSVVVSPTGSGSVSPASATVPKGTWVTLIPAPASGYKFFEWEMNGGFGSSINPTLVLLMDSSKTITAHFVPADRVIGPPP